MLVDNVEKQENKRITTETKSKFDEMKQKAYEEVEQMKIQNDIVINKLINQNRLAMQQHKVSITQPTKKSSKFFGILILAICTIMFIGSTLATLVSGLTAYMEVSQTAGIGFALIMGGIPTFLYVMALCNNKIKNDFRRFLSFYNFICNIVLIISITFNFRFLYAMKLNIFYSIVLFLTCVILDICWFFGIQYAVSLLTYRTDDTQKHVKVSVTEMLLDNIFFPIRKRIQKKYNENNNINSQGNTLESSQENNKNQSKQLPENTDKNLQDSSQKNTSKTSQDKNATDIESHAPETTQNSQDSRKKKNKQTDKNNTNKSRKKSTSGSSSSGKRKSSKTDYEKAIEFMENKLEDGKESCKILVGDLKKSCKITDHNWLQKVRPELIKNDIIENHQKDTIYKRKTIVT